MLGVGYVSHSIFTPRQRDQILVSELSQIGLSDRTIEYRMGVISIPEEKRNIEYAYIWQEVRKWRACDEGQIHRTELHGFEHFNLTAQCGVRILLDLIATLCSLLDFVCEYGTSSAKLR